jgi:hypothetical protein
MHKPRGAEREGIFFNLDVLVEENIVLPQNKLVHFDRGRRVEIAKPVRFLYPRQKKEKKRKRKKRK